MEIAQLGDDTGHLRTGLGRPDDLDVGAEPQQAADRFHDGVDDLHPQPAVRSSTSRRGPCQTWSGSTPGRRCAAASTCGVRLHP
ncbi:hypothetical protein ACH4FA_05775 [Streptomyces sp. NPDC017966]|uniref:hypothetical protein n=1 Tax=Streptomyces sp. NPDC017966 TaxID=3365023 RepID=UPI0037AB969C